MVFVYLVIVAVAFVHMTGSGMGCPGWPNCFGYYIPPIDESELQWKANQDYKKRQVIICNELLQLYSKNFIIISS